MAKIKRDELSEYVAKRACAAVKNKDSIKFASIEQELVSSLEGFEFLEEFGSLQSLPHVAALVIDVRESTKRFHEIGALNSYITIEAFLPVLAKLVAYFGGTVVQFTGDGLFSLFYKKDEIYKRACYCAGYMMLTIDNIVNSILEKIEITIEGDLPPIDCGVGLDSGSCFVVKTGSERYAVITPYGNCINNASKMSIGNKSVMLSNNFYKLVQGESNDMIFNRIDNDTYKLDWSCIKFPTPDYGTKKIYH